MCDPGTVKILRFDRDAYRQTRSEFLQVNGWDMTMVTHDQARKRLTKRNEEVVRLLVTRHSLQKAVQQSMLSQPCH